MEIVIVIERKLMKIRLWLIWDFLQLSEWLTDHHYFKISATMFISQILYILKKRKWKYWNFLIRQFYNFTNNQTLNSTRRNNLRFNSFNFNKMLSHFMVNVKNQQPFRNYSLKHRKGKLFRKHLNLNSRI